MYYFLSLLIGTIVALMVMLNGMLSAHHGLYTGSVIIHFIGFIIITAIILVKRENPFKKSQRWYLYIGGSLGVLAVICSNFAFGKIGVSAIMAIGLLSESIISIIADQLGLMGVKRPFKKTKLIRLLFLFAGTVIMTTSIEILAVAAAVLSGLSIGVSRLVNGKLAALTSLRVGTFYNFFVGLSVSVLVFIVTSAFFNNQIGSHSLSTFAFSSSVYIYFGSMMGVCVVMLSSIVIARLSAFSMSLLLFIGQVFTGIAIDAVLTQTFSFLTLAGGLLVTFGLCLDLLLDRRSA